MAVGFLEMLFALFMPFMATETTLPILLFLQFAAGGTGGDPADLAVHLPPDTMAYARLTHDAPAAKAVRAAVEKARRDGEFEALMDGLLAETEGDGGFVEGGFVSMVGKIQGVHIVFYGFDSEGPYYSFVFEMVDEAAALEVLDHSDRFFQEPMFEAAGEGRYHFLPAGNDGLGFRVGNLVVFGTRAELTAGQLTATPEQSLATSPRYQAARGQGDAILFGYADGERFFAELRGALDFDDQKEFDQVDSFVGFSEIESLALSTTWKDGSLQSGTTVSIPEDALLRVYQPDLAELDPGLLIRVGGGSRIGLQVADPAGWWKRIEAHLLEQEEMLGWSDIADGLGQFQEATGKSVGQLLSMIDGRMAVGMPRADELLSKINSGRMALLTEEEEGKPMGLPVVVAFRLADADGTQKFLEWMLSEGPMSEGVERIAPVEHDGVAIHGLVMEGLLVRYYFDGDVLVFGGDDLEASIDRAHTDWEENPADVYARLFEPVGGPGHLAFAGGNTGGGMGVWFLLLVGGRAMAGMAGGPGVIKEATRVPYRQPIEIEEGRAAVGAIRFGDRGLVSRSSQPVDAASVKGTTAIILRTYFQSQVDTCVETVATIYTMIHKHKDDNDAWPETLDELMNDEDRFWIMGCPEHGESMERPSTAYTYLTKKTEGVADEDALWVYETESNHRLGRVALFRDGKVTFLYEKDFEKALARTKGK